MKPTVYHCEADVELVSAARRYECQSEALGRRFLRAVHVVLENIREDPERFAFYDKPARSCLVRGFPYRVIYEVLPDAIYILAVAHTSLEPGYWKSRFA